MKIQSPTSARISALTAPRRNLVSAPQDTTAISGELQLANAQWLFFYEALKQRRFAAMSIERLFGGGRRWSRLPSGSRSRRQRWRQRSVPPVTDVRSDACGEF